jgi:hypothetical protein
MSTEALLARARAHFRGRCDEARELLGQARFGELESELERDPASFLADESKLVVFAAEARQAVLLLEEAERTHARAHATGPHLEEVRSSIDRFMQVQCAQLDQRVRARTLGLASRLSSMQQQLDSLASTRAQLFELQRRVEVSEVAVAELASMAEQRVGEAIESTLRPHEARLNAQLADEARKAKAEGSAAAERALAKHAVDVQSRLDESHLASAKLGAAFSAKVTELQLQARELDAARVGSQLLQTRLQQNEARLAALEEAMHLAGQAKLDALEPDGMNISGVDAVQQGVPVVSMGMVRATLARRAEVERQVRADELRVAEQAGATEWLRTPGLGSDLLTAGFVNLEKGGLTDAHMVGVALLILLKVKASLNRLDLHNSKIGDAGAALLAPLFKSMAPLNVLVLAKNQIGDKGATALAQAFCSMASLRELGLGSNQIGDVGATELAQAFPSMASLNRLDLENNQIGDVGAAELAQALPSMESLQALGLDGNQIGDVGATKLAQAFRSMASLQALGLDGNQIGDVGATELARAFPSMASLNRLDLENNQIGDVGAAALAQALPSMKSLDSLWIGGNKMRNSCSKDEIRSAFSFKHVNL